MKRLGLILVLLLFAPLASASTFLGWVTTPGDMHINGYTLRIEDVGLDGSIYLEISNGSVTKGFKLYPGDSAVLDFAEVTLNRTFIGAEGHVLIKASFPYVLTGEGIHFNGYNFTLLSVNEKGFKARVSDGNVTKDFSSKDFTFGNFKFHVEPYPLVFEGYLERGKSVEYFGHTVTFKNATVENTTQGYSERVTLTIDGSSYEVNVGDEFDSGIFHVKTEDLKGVDYLKITVNLRGAYVDMISSPDFEDYVYEGKDVKLGPFLVRVDRVLGGQVYLSIRNECGQELAGGLVGVGGTPLKGVAYKGLEVAVESLASDSNGVKAKLIAFIDPRKIPKVEGVSWLDVTFTAPENVTQYVPFEATVSLKNLGTAKLRNIKVEYNGARGVEVLSPTGTFLDELAPGKGTKFSIKLRINATGEKNLGKLTVRADVPYELACNGYTTLTFHSNSPVVNVLPAHVAYALSLELPNTTPVGAPFTGVLRVKNEGDVELPVVVEVPLGGHFALTGADLRFEGGYLRSEVNLRANETREYYLTLVGISPGNWTLTPRVLFRGNAVNSTSSTIEVLPREPEVVYVNATNTTCEPKVVYVNVTKPCNCTNTTVTVTQTVSQVVEVPKIVKENVTVEVVPLKGKLMWMGIGIAVGMGIIILVAWYQAQRS